MRHDLFSLFGMLAIVILILVLAYWVTRWIAAGGARTAGGRIRSPGGAGRVRILGQLNLGRGERLVLACVSGRCYLLGVTAGSVTLLKELPDGEAAEWLEERETPVPPGFLEVLKENLRKGK